MLDKASNEDFPVVSELIKVLGSVSQKHIVLSNKASELCDEYLLRVSRAVPMSNNICQIEPEEDVLLPLLEVEQSVLASDIGDNLASLFMPWVDNDSNKLFNPFDFMDLSDEWLREQIDREQVTPITEEQIVVRKGVKDRFTNEVIETSVGFIEEALMRSGDSITLLALCERLKQDFKKDPELDNLIKCLLMICVDWYAHQDHQTTAFQLIAGDAMELEGQYFVNNYVITRTQGGLL